METRLAPTPLGGLRAPAWIGASWLRRHGWLVYLAAVIGIAFVVTAFSSNETHLVIVSTAGMAAVAAILIGVRANRPSRPLKWRLMALCFFLTALGTAVNILAGLASPIGQALHVSGDVVGAVAFVMLVRGRIPGGDRIALVDSAILASGVGVLIWSFGLAPLIVASRQDPFTPGVIFYATLIALGVAARMWFLEGAHRPATRLIVLFLIAANIVTTVDLLSGLFDAFTLETWSFLAVMATVGLVGAAALHPTMAIRPEPQSPDLGPISRRRMAALMTALLVNPATLAIQLATGRPVDAAPYIIGGVVIAVLVIIRLGDALQRLAESLHERDGMMELLSHQALYDPLTSLPNRNLFNQRLDTAMAGRSPGQVLAVLLLDIDDFKNVNDSYGHETGDALLAAVGFRLREAIRDGDTAARLGGDEFVIILPGYDEPRIPVQIAERILKAMGQPFQLGPHQVGVRVSIGIAIAGADDRTTDDVVRNADVAMYLAKTTGKNRIEVFEPSMQAAATVRLHLRTDLEAGIAAGDLRLHFQPVIDLRSNLTVGYEALVRWQREGRLVRPAEFIAIAESSGLIGPLTDWVVNEACRATVSWGSDNDRPWVSVNLPPSQVIRVDMAHRLRASLTAVAMDPTRLVVEITESSLLDVETARPAIARLSDLGVRVAIDDFGIGYSALSYLAHLPIDIVKIDRSFVVALGEGGPQEAIASAIIALANRLGMITIGEGIETVAQLDRLYALGCDLGQGFHLGSPAPGESQPFVARRRRRVTRQGRVGSLIA